MLTRVVNDDAMNNLSSVLTALKISVYKIDLPGGC